MSPSVFPQTEPTIHPSALIAASATVRGMVTVHARAVIMFGAVLRAEEAPISAGSETNFQDNVVVHTDRGFPALIGNRTTIGHAAVVHGATIGDGCLVGIGSVALNGSRLGEGAWLAAGAVLAEGKEIPPWTIGVGIPAKPLRELTESEIERQRSGVRTYLELGLRYQRSGDMAASI